VKRLGVALLCALNLTHSWAEVVPPRGDTDPRVRSATYDGNQVYKLRGVVGYQVDLEFEAGEQFTGLGAGDIEGLSFVGQENHLFLKPKALKVATNITVLTNRRHYQFDYAASLKAVTDDDSVFVLRFTYPETQSKADIDAASRKVDAQLQNAAQARRQNVDYWFCGDPSLRPVAASDDGLHTRLSFSPQAELPAIFVRNDDASESLLNFSMDSGDVIIHRVARRFVLRRGRLTGCIVNQGYSGGTSRLGTGTVAPDVDRKVQRSAP
jgi:type IV secretion system protein VirB9